MTDTEFLADQLRRAHTGEAWHGPALKEILDGVTAEMACARPVPQAHTIWEIVRHVSAWLGAAGRRMSGEAVELIGEHDWPTTDSTDAAWQKTLAELDRETAALQEAIAKLPAELLRKGVPGRNYSVRFLLEGIVQHHLYHAGQILMLKKFLTR
jgi:uncharacterized damage-inducible protein DinB